MLHITTIAAIATPAGQGGIGIIRISGPQVPKIANLLLSGKTPIPRYAHFATFYDHTGNPLDQGIALFFPQPNSFTGEDVLELQVHGSPFLLNLLLKQVLTLGADLARPGEFSERAFVNGKIDLIQAEAIADVIGAISEKAAIAGIRSLQGNFSARIKELVEAIIQLRVYVEAWLDFPDEDIDIVSNQFIIDSLAKIQSTLKSLQNSTQQGVLIREGIQVVIAGEPNAGKSSLLNLLSGEDRAIVTPIPGTTRDILKESIQIAGLTIHLVDTAGLRITNDPIETEGIRRAETVMLQADHILWIKEFQKKTDLSASFLSRFDLTPDKLTIIYNKIDLDAQQIPCSKKDRAGFSTIYLSAKTNRGIDLLKSHLQSCLSCIPTTESSFIARQRHLDLIDKTKTHLNQAQALLDQQAQVDFVLVAEELRLAQFTLFEMTGTFLPDDLLGKIFSQFCVGK